MRKMSFLLKGRPFNLALVAQLLQLQGLLEESQVSRNLRIYGHDVEII